LVVIWKPYYLYREGFKLSVASYWRQILSHTGILVGCLFVNLTIKESLAWDIQPTLPGIVQYSACIMLPIIILYSLATYFCCTGAKDLVHRLPIRR